MELSEIREKLDVVDKQLLDLFLQRMNLVDQVAEIKKNQSQALYDPKREREILSRIHDAAGEPHGAAAHQLFRTLLELSRARQAAQLISKTNVSAVVDELCAHELSVFPQTGRIACAGIEGSNAQMAADRLFSRGDVVYLDSFSAVAKAVKAGLCQYGVLPIENSTTGSIRRVYDILCDPELSVIRSLRLLVRHVLLTQPNAEISQIRTIYTHEQAAAQCSKFLSELSGVDVIPCKSTAHAAKRAADAADPSVAAIAGEVCAKLYGLTVLSADIQNQQNNGTRFVCITKGSVCYAGADRLSLMLTTQNRAGALFDLLAKISALGINLCKLESVPIQGSNFSYRFYMDLETSLHQEGLLGLLSELERSCDEFRLLGCYSEIAE